MVIHETEITKDTQEVETILKEENTEDTYVSPNQWALVVKRIRNSKVGRYSFYYILFNILLAFFHPLFLTWDPTVTDPGSDSRYGGGAQAFPNLKYPFGTAQIGYDSYSRIITGSETSILVGIVAAMLSIMLGVLVGLAAGYYKGRVEEAFMRLADLFLAVPFLLLALILLRIVNSGQAVILQNLSYVAIITLLIGIFGWAGLSRLVTANVKQVGALEYVQAVKIMGAKDRRIIFLHILPNVLAPIIVITALSVAGAILSEAGLAFLGFSDAANTVSWGVDVALNRQILQLHPDQVLIPGFAIFFLVLAVNIFGDIVRDALDPRLKE